MCTTEQSLPVFCLKLLGFIANKDFYSYVRNPWYLAHRLFDKFSFVFSSSSTEQILPVFCVQNDYDLFQIST